MLINAMTAMFVAINKNNLVMLFSRVAVFSTSNIVAYAENFNSMDRLGAENNIH